MSHPTPANATQNLLKRHSGSTYEEFSQYYKQHHGVLAMPWFMANTVTYYAQIHRPLSWSSEEARQKYAHQITLEDWDAVAEITLETTDVTGNVSPITFSKGESYYSEIILPDERKLLLCEAMKHMLPVEPGSVVGDRIVFITEGKAVVEYEDWQKVWDSLKTA